MYVLKKMDLRKASKKERLAAEQEAKLLSDLKHPNIVAYKDTFEGGDGFLYIAMGFCERGDLYSRLKEEKGAPLEERQVVEWFVQIAMALQYMHDRHILHRDLKTQNIFLTKNKIIKVGDLGIARVLDSSSDMATTLIGTPYYMSPELFSNKPYNFKSDVWALGCCVYEMTTLKHAFNAKDMNSLMYRVLRGKLPPMPDMYKKELVDLIKAMLNKNPDKRPSVNRILRDPYIKENIAIFLEGTKNSANTNRRPGSAKKDRPASRDGNRPRKPKPEVVLEPLNVGSDVLEPIKEECTPRDGGQVSSGSLQNQQKGSNEINHNGPLEAKSEKNSSEDSKNNAEVLLAFDKREPKRQSGKSSSRQKDKKDAQISKLSKKDADSDSSDPSKQVIQNMEALPKEKINQPGKSSTNVDSKAAANFNPVEVSSSAENLSDKVRSAAPKKRSSSITELQMQGSKPPVSDTPETETPVIKTRASVSDFRPPVTDLKPVMSHHRASISASRRSSASDLKPPVVPVSRASVPISKSESSPCISASKSRPSSSRPRVSGSSGCLVENEKRDTESSRPLPPRPMSSSINPEQSRAIVLKNSKVVQSNCDSGRSSSTSSSGYSGKEEVGDASDDRVSASVGQVSPETPVPMWSLESSARQRRRQQQQQQLQTPRNSRSLDVSLCPVESVHVDHSSSSGKDKRHVNSLDFEARPRRHHAEGKPFSDHTDLKRSEPEKQQALSSSHGSNSSSDLEDEEEQKRKAEEREEHKEIDSFINLLGTTLRLQKKSKDSDDEADSGVEAVPEIQKQSNVSRSICNATFLVPAPSPLPPGAKFPYIDENSRPISARNAKHHKTPTEPPNADVIPIAMDQLDSAISMTTTGRLFERIALLRKDCIHALGVEKLKIAYDILDHFDTDELEPKLIDLLGQDYFDAYAGKIWQLKFCEESAFKSQ